MYDKVLKIGFISSSDFCIPIVEKLKQFNGKTFGELLDEETNINGYLIKNNYEYTKFENQLEGIKKLVINLEIVVTQPDNIIRNKPVPSPISKWASTNQIPLWNPVNINKETNAIFESLDIVITASFGQLISQRLLDLPKFGFINWHPSLLPLYRGPIPMQSTILNQDSSYGLSWITMTKEMDAGKILIQLERNLKPELNFDNMARELGALGSKTIKTSLLHQILNLGEIQNESKIVFCNKLNRPDQFIYPKNLNSKQIQAHVNAFIRYPGTIFDEPYFGGNIKIMECSVLEPDEIEYNKVIKFGNLNLSKNGKKQIVFITCKDNSFLQLKKIINTNGKQIDLSGFQFK